jgi:hemolysin activation/secretion protein
MLTCFQCNLPISGILALIALTSTFLSAKPLLAQDSLPSSQEQPSRVEQDLTIPNPLPSPSRLTIPESTDLKLPPGSETQIFHLTTLQVNGVTVYPAEKLESLYGKYLNQDISLREIYAIANQIVQQYQVDGYLLAQAIIPAQTIEDGIVTINITEGYIESVSYEGASTRQLDRLDGFAEKIQASVPLNRKDLDRYILLAGD